MRKYIQSENSNGFSHNFDDYKNKKENERKIFFLFHWVLVGERPTWYTIAEMYTRGKAHRVWGDTAIFSCDVFWTTLNNISISSLHITCWLRDLGSPTEFNIRRAVFNFSVSPEINRKTRQLWAANCYLAWRYDISTHLFDCLFWFAAVAWRAPLWWLKRENLFREIRVARPSESNDAKRNIGAGVRC